MKDTIDQNHKNLSDMRIKRVEEAKRSAEELQKFHNDERMRRGDRTFKNEYRNILESQVKMKNMPHKFKINDLDNMGDDVSNINTSRKGEMYMIPGLNSVSPYVKNHSKGKVALGEHYSKMKNYIDHNKVRFVNT